jgi:hypothetical protein
MTCPVCSTDYEQFPEVCACGTPLILDNETREIFRIHAHEELRRNLKGLIGYGFLTFMFGLPSVFLPIGLVAVTINPTSNNIGQFLATVIDFPIAFFSFKALRRRWIRRQYYQTMEATPPIYFPARAPGLSEKQYAKEIERLKALDTSLATHRAASGHIETTAITPLPQEIRAQHVWIPGLPGYGKSTLMHWMAVQDIAAGKGITILDPAGDLVGNALPDDPDRHVAGIVDWIPEERVEDTIYIDLKTPIPIDFFNYANDDEKQDLAGNLIELFNRLGEMFGGQQGVRFTGIVRDIVYTLFEAKENGCLTSFLDIYDFIKDPDRRKEILDVVSTKTRSSWDRFPNDEKTEPIISRLTAIAKNPRLRTIFGTPDAKLKIADVMNEKSILLVNIGGATESGIILGTMIISQLLQAGMRRSEMPKHKRVPHHIYIDEFHNFQVGSDMAKILTQCRKYQLCLTIANQYTAQIPNSTLSAVFGGTSTWFLFRLSPQDIPIFPKNLPSIAYTGVYEKQVVEATDLQYFRQSLSPDWLKDPNYEKPQDVLVDLKPIPFDPKILATLQVGEAIHRKADGTAEKVKTVAMGHPPNQSFANLIRERTNAQYAPKPPREPKADLESKRDDPEPEPANPFPNEGATRGPKRPR